MMAPSEARMVPRLPPELTAAQSKLVYLQLQAHPGARARELRDQLGLPSLALFPTLRSLEDRGLVERHGDGYRCRE